MTRKVDQLVVSDEELAEAAEVFVIADLKRREARVERNQLLQATTCFRHGGSDESVRTCFDALKLGRILEKSELCENCQEVNVKSNEVKLASARRNGKLRRLRTLVARRLKDAEKLEL